MTAHLVHQNINIDSDITLAVTHENNEVYLYDVYSSCSYCGSELVITKIGSFSVEYGLKIVNPGGKINSRMNLQGISINVGVLTTGIKRNQTLIEFLESTDNPLVDAQHRHHYRLFKIFAERLNFRMLIHHAPTWGFLRNGSFNGLLEMFQTNQIELSITPFRFLLERLQVIQFTVSTWISTPTLVFRHPKNALRNPFLQPLSPMVWNTILIIMAVVSSMITVSMRCQRVMNVTVIRAFMTSMGIICQQGLMENFSRLSTRMLLFVFLSFSYLIFQFYSSFIVGSLLTDPPKTINNLRQLIDSELKVGIENVSYNVDFFERTNDPLSIELLHKKVKNKRNFFGAIEGLKKVKNGGFVFLVDTSYGYRMIEETFSEKELCQLHEIFIYPIFRTAVSVAKTSKYREIVAVEFTRYKERGIESYHNMKWRRMKPKCIKSVTRSEAINIEEASWILMVLVASIFVSFFAAGFENLYFFIFERKMRERKILQVRPYFE